MQEITFQDRHFLLLNLAANCDHIDIVRFLLDNQPLYARIHERTWSKLTAILRAADAYNITRQNPISSQESFDRKEAVMNLLLDRGACASDVIPLFYKGEVQNYPLS